MLKNLIAIILNILLLAFIWLLFKYLYIFIVNNGYKIGVFSFYRYYHHKINEAIYGFLILLGIAYLFYVCILKLRLKANGLSKRGIAIIIGIVLLLESLLVTNVFGMVRPKFTDANYLLNLFFTFIVGFILPYSEKSIKRILDNSFLDNLFYDIVLIVVLLYN